MNHAAKVVLNEFEDIILGYGQSDEYSFVFRRETEVCTSAIYIINHSMHIIILICFPN